MKRETKIFLALLAILLLMAVLWIVFNNKNKQDCNSYQVDKCPGECVVCPPCAYCSSISCQTGEYCQSIGFNRSWYERVRPR